MKKVIHSILSICIFASPCVVYADQPQDPISAILQKMGAHTDTEQNVIPILISFDKSLFNRYCTAILERSEAIEFSLFTEIICNSTIFSLLYGFPMSTKIAHACTACWSEGITPQLDILWDTTKNACDFSSISNGGKTLFKGAFLIYCAYSATYYIARCAAKLRQLQSQSFEKEQVEWRENMLQPLTQQEATWHKIIYEKFDKPIINKGASNNTYQLVLHKKYGAGYQYFDPTNSEHVEILLGLHPAKRDDLRCTHIDIIPIAIPQ